MAKNSQSCYKNPKETSKAIYYHPPKNYLFFSTHKRLLHRNNSTQGKTQENIEPQQKRRKPLKQTHIFPHVKLSIPPSDAPT